MKYLLVFPLFILSGLYLEAQNIVTDRPDQTEASSIVPVNSLQIEMGLISQRTSQDEAKSLAFPSTLLRYSFNEVIELRVYNQYETHFSTNQNGSPQGFSDLEIGGKFQVFKRNTCATEVAFLTHAVLPTAKETLSNKSLGVISKLSISHLLSNTLSLGYNLGHSFLDTIHSFTYSLALGLSITDKVGCYIEPYGSCFETGFVESNFDGGITYLLRQNIQLDASYGFGLNHTMSYISLGLSWNITTVF